MFSNSTSDETVLYLRRKWEVSERVLEPLDLSADEMLDFIAQECYGVNYEGGGWKISLPVSTTADPFPRPLPGHV